MGAPPRGSQPLQSTETTLATTLVGRGWLPGERIGLGHAISFGRHPDQLHDGPPKLIRYRDRRGIRSFLLQAIERRGFGLAPASALFAKGHDLVARDPQRPAGAVARAIPQRRRFAQAPT